MFNLEDIENQDLSQQPLEQRSATQEKEEGEGKEKTHWEGVMEKERSLQWKGNSNLKKNWSCKNKNLANLRFSQGFRIAD
jgi:hypothetical protein